MRPLGRPPMPSAMSSPSEPEDTVSTSIERSFLPSFITLPLPNWRSIWDSAADRALLLSMEDPSTIRRAVADMGSCSLWRGFAGWTNTCGDLASTCCGENNVPHLFHVRNMFFLRTRAFPRPVHLALHCKL